MRILAPAVLAGALLRAYGLDAADLWLDEANTVVVAAQPVDSLLRELAAEDVHPPLFYLLVHLPLALSRSEAGLRAVPWLFGVLSIPLAYLVARDLSGRRAGGVAAVLAAFSAPLVAFSQEGRMYSLLACLELAAAWCLIRALETGGRWWLGFAATSILALYTHNIAVLYLVAHLAAAVWCGAPPRRVALWSGVILAGYAPWLPIAAAQAVRVQAEGGWLGPPPPAWIPGVTLVNLLLGTELRHGLLWPRFALERPYLLAPALPLLAFGWRRLRGRPAARRVLLATGLAPLGLALGLSQATRIYVDKSFLAGSLLLIVVMSASAARVAGRDRHGWLLAVAALLVAQLWAVAWSWQAPRDSYRGLVRDLLAEWQPSDQVQAVPWFLARPLRFYLERAGASLPVLEARSTGEPPEAAGAARLWVVTGPWDDHPASLAAARWRERMDYSLAGERHYPDPSLRLALYTHRRQAR